MISAAAALVRETYWYLRHRLTGSSYVEYYARRMDSIVSRDPDWGLNVDRSFQLRYLRGRGLTPATSLLDFGCGALAAGLLFIDFLEPGRYCGADISAGALAEGRRRIARARLEAKRPLLFKLDSTSLAPLEGRRFDVIWAQSVFTHMPPDDIAAVLREFGAAMNPGAAAYATYASGAAAPEQRRYKDWYYGFGFFEQAARKAGLTVEQMGDWHHPVDPAGTDRMLRFSSAQRTL
jgi:SAM-dependent methyltransferase